MSDGPLTSGDGDAAGLPRLTYYAAFEITGDLDRTELKAAVGKIKQVFDDLRKSGKKADGQILMSARISAAKTDKTPREQSKPKITFNLFE
jgi:hypothetical protein